MVEEGECTPEIKQGSWEIKKFLSSTTYGVIAQFLSATHVNVHLKRSHCCEIIGCPYVYGIEAQEIKEKMKHLEESCWP